MKTENISRFVGCSMARHRLLFSFCASQWQRSDAVRPWTCRQCWCLFASLLFDITFTRAQRNHRIFLSFIASLCARRSISRIWLQFMIHFIMLHSLPSFAYCSLLVSGSAVPLTPSLRHKENSAQREIKKVEKTETRRKKINGRKKHAGIGKQDLLTRMNGGGRLRIIFHVFFAFSVSLRAFPKKQPEKVI